MLPVDLPQAESIRFTAYNTDLARECLEMRCFKGAECTATCDNHLMRSPVETQIGNYYLKFIVAAWVSLPSIVSDIEQSLYTFW